MGCKTKLSTNIECNDTLDHKETMIPIYGAAFLYETNIENSFEELALEAEIEFPHKNSFDNLLVRITNS